MGRWLWAYRRTPVLATPRAKEIAKENARERESERERERARLPHPAHMDVKSCCRQHPRGGHPYPSRLHRARQLGGLIRVLDNIEIQRLPPVPFISCRMRVSRRASWRS